MGLSLQIDEDALANLDRNLKGVRERLKRAYIAAVDETNEEVGNETVSLLSREVNAEREDIRDRVIVNKVKDGRFVTASVTILSEPRLSMRSFNPQQQSTGVHVQPLKRTSTASLYRVRLVQTFGGLVVVSGSDEERHVYQLENYRESRLLA